MTIIEAAAADLGHLRREGALGVLVVVAEKRYSRFERAAARFAARVIIERRLSPAETGNRALALAQGLPEAPDATLVLRGLCVDGYRLWRPRRSLARRIVRHQYRAARLAWRSSTAVTSSRTR